MQQKEMVEIDLAGKVVPVPRDVVGALAAAAAARAGVSGQHRDLSLESRRATLGLADVRTLRAVLEEAHPDLGPAAAELRQAVA